MTSLGWLLACGATGVAGAQPVEPRAGSLRADAAGSVARLQTLDAPAWAHASRGPSRVAAINLQVEPWPPALSAPGTLVTQTQFGESLEPIPGAPPVLVGSMAYAVAFVGGFESLLAIDLPSAAVRWVAELPPLELDSRSGPAFDTNNNTVLIAMGDELLAFGAKTGQWRWSTVLPTPVVNASPLVTTDLGPADRAFITDYGFFADAGRLHCVNVDRFDAILNPHEPGQLIWSVALDAATSGNTPAYANGTVFVASAGDGFSAGTVQAFAADAANPPAPRWTFTNPLAAGFFGGVSVRDGSVYAASYNFNGGQLNSNLVKLSAETGALRWSRPSNRTSSTPIPLADGRVVLAGGVPPDPVFGDFGSRPSVGVYAADGTLLLETALDTWQDLDNDSAIDANEYLAVGGWTDQPVVLESAHWVSVWASAGSPIGSAGLARLDLGWTPGSPTPLVLEATPLGSGPSAAAGGWSVTPDPFGFVIRGTRTARRAAGVTP